VAKKGLDVMPYASAQHERELLLEPATKGKAHKITGPDTKKMGDYDEHAYTVELEQMIPIIHKDYPEPGKDEKAHKTPKGSEGSSTEQADRDPAAERISESPMATGQPISLADKDEKAHNTPKGSEGSSPEKADRDPATERIWDSPMPTGQPIPFDPELYEPPMSQEEFERLSDDEDREDLGR
jgi:hypothetical protein